MDRPVAGAPRGCRAAHRCGAFRRRSGSAAGHVARSVRALALRARTHPEHRRIRSPCSARGAHGSDRRGRQALGGAVRGGSEGADGALVPGGRQGALRGRAGRDRRRRGPLPRRGCARSACGSSTTRCPAAADIDAAIAADAPVLHEAVGSNVVSDRRFVYGDPDAAFAAAPHRVRLTVRYPRNSCTPIECFVVVAEHLAGDEGYDVLANFMGPFSLHAVMALALKVPAAKLRLRVPRDSGGSFGVKQAVFPYVVALCLAARKAGAPVKWVEDRLEHLAGRDLRDRPPEHDRGRGGARRAHHGAVLRSARRLRRLSARAGAGHVLPHARLPDRGLRHPSSAGAQPRGADQQDAGRAGARVRRPAGVLRAGAAGAADRRRAEPRSPGGVPAQLHRPRSVPVSCPRRRADRLGRLSPCRWIWRRRRVGSRSCSRGASRHAARGGCTASATLRSSSPRSPTWATSPPFCPPRRARRRDRRMARSPARP